MAKRRSLFESIFKKFGFKPKTFDERLQKFEGKTPEEAYTALQEKTGKNQNLDFKQFASARPDLFPGYQGPYYGLRPKYINKQLNKSQELAQGYFQPDFNQLDQNQAVTAQRNAENLQTDTAQLARNRALLDQNYQFQNAQNQFGNTIQNQNLVGDINAVGQFDSGIGQLRQQQLAQQQAFGQQALDNNYQNDLSNLDTNTQLLNRNYDRQLYDVEDYYKNQRRNLEKQRDAYGNQLFGNQIDYAGNYNYKNYLG